MSKIKGTNSILLLYLRSIFRMRWSWFNFTLPFIISIMVALLFSELTLESDKLIELQDDIAESCLSFNGAVLGFIIAAFAIFASIGDRNLIIFSITTKRDGDYYSFHKTKLLTFFKSFFWLYTACIICFLYKALLFLNNNIMVGTWELVLPSFFIPNVILFFAQSKVFIELKVLIFTIYNSSLTQARFIAQDDGKVPVDDSND